jgi:predicted homoserine dehydrogenase-like protein
LLRYHVVDIEANNSNSPVVQFGDGPDPPLGGPVVDVCAVAKCALAAGDVLQEFGPYMTYDVAVYAYEMWAGRYVTEGFGVRRRLTRAVVRVDVLAYDDVELPKQHIADRLRA